MTEQEWLTSKDPAAMFHFLQTGGKGRVSISYPVIYSTPHPVLTDRKARLYACACCLARGTDIEIVEKYEKEGMKEYPNGLSKVEDKIWAKGWTERGSNRPRLSLRANLLRDIFGNPFRMRVVLPRDIGIVLENKAENYQQDDVILEDVLQWHSGLIPSMAQTIYQERRWEEMPILADALEEAGCTDEETLAHCRFTHPPGPTEKEVIASKDSIIGCCDRHADYMACDCLEQARASEVTHVRGCWVLDLLRGKN
jgi:hypothetical protein